jgi:hypothetical protein
MSVNLSIAMLTDREPALITRDQDLKYRRRTDADRRKPDDRRRALDGHPHAPVGRRRISRRLVPDTSLGQLARLPIDEPIDCPFAAGA